MDGIIWRKLFVITANVPIIISASWYVKKFCKSALPESVTLIPCFFNKYIWNGCPPDEKGVIALKNCAEHIRINVSFNL